MFMTRSSSVSSPVGGGVKTGLDGVVAGVVGAPSDVTMVPQ